MDEWIKADGHDGLGDQKKLVKMVETLEHVTVELRDLTKKREEMQRLLGLVPSTKACPGTHPLKLASSYGNQYGHGDKCGACGCTVFTRKNGVIKIKIVDK